MRRRGKLTDVSSVPEMTRPNLDQAAVRGWPDRLTVWRWHFYAGLLCIPFVLWLAATGSIYLFKPQIDAWIDRPYEHLAAGAASANPSAQVAAALTAVPGSVLSAYELPGTTQSAVQVLVGHGTQLKRVYIHPVTLQVLKVIDEDSRLTNQIFHLHGELMAGDRGSMLVETAASWTIVMLITGLYLWWPRGVSGLAGVVYPRLQRRSRLFWIDLHAVTGFWVTFFALFLLISGLPWAKSWGGLLKDLRHWNSAGAPVRQDWTTGRSSELDARKLSMTAPVADEHAGHHHGSESNGAIPGDYQPLDGLVPAVRAARLPAPVLIEPPSGAHASWTARSDTQNRPLRAELKLDGARSVIVSRHDFWQRPLLDRMIGIGIAAHEGQLFAPLNQLLGLFTAVSLWLVCISAIVMWWRRRPAGVLGAPPPVVRAPLATSVIAVIVLLGIALPLLGLTLLVVWTVERMLLRRWPAARTFLSLSPA
jgi:uncharacterized iron-regulated membrane protein